MFIGEVIQHIRKDEGLSQEDFGMMFQLSQRDVSNIENGKTEPDKRFLNIIALQFNSPVVKAYICGKQDADLLDQAIEIFRTNKVIQYA